MYWALVCLVVVTSGNMGHFAEKNMADDNLDFDLEMLVVFSCASPSDRQIHTLF